MIQAAKNHKNIVFLTHVTHFFRLVVWYILRRFDDRFEVNRKAEAIYEKGSSNIRRNRAKVRNLDFVHLNVVIL